jgi:hypothetical protein
MLFNMLDMCSISYLLDGVHIVSHLAYSRSYIHKQTYVKKGIFYSL